MVKCGMKLLSFLNFNSRTVEVSEWMSNTSAEVLEWIAIFILRFTERVVIGPGWD